MKELNNYNFYLDKKGDYILAKINSDKYTLSGFKIQLIDNIIWYTLINNVCKCHFENLELGQIPSKISLGAIEFIIYQNNQTK
jgi:hypothetical protein